jgi:hypothetical protein
MGIIEDMMKAFDRIPGMKEIQALPERMTALEARITSLEAALARCPAEGWTRWHVSAEAQVIFDDAPTPALQGLIAKGADETVGGTIQQAWAAGGQFFPVMNAVFGARQGGNLAFNVLGYDMDGDQFTVGNHWVGLFGRF